MDGISIVASIGRPVWPKVQIGSCFLRVVFGPFGLLIVLRDMDLWLGNLSNKESR
jgi:hypothetical protein